MSDEIPIPRRPKRRKQHKREKEHEEWVHELLAIHMTNNEIVRFFDTDRVVEDELSRGNEVAGFLTDNIDSLPLRTLIALAQHGLRHIDGRKVAHLIMAREGGHSKKLAQLTEPSIENENGEDE